MKSVKEETGDGLSKIYHTTVCCRVKEMTSTTESGKFILSHLILPRIESLTKDEHIKDNT